MKYKNIIFDLGNVLVALDNEACARAFIALGCERLVNVDSDPAVKQLFDQLGLGLITNGQFYAQVRLLTGTTATDAQIDAACNAMLTVIPDVKKQRLLDLRQAGCHTFLLSNTIDIHWRYCLKHLWPYGNYGIDDFFDQAFVSQEMHLLKPSREIFQAVIDRTGIVPADTLFIDDIKENCEGAERLGIHTFNNVHFNDWLALDLYCPGSPWRGALPTDI